MNFQNYFEKKQKVSLELAVSLASPVPVTSPNFTLSPGFQQHTWIPSCITLGHLEEQ